MAVCLTDLLEEARTARADSESKVERCQSELLVTRNNGQEATLRADHLRTQLKVRYYPFPTDPCPPSLVIRDPEGR